MRFATDPSAKTWEQMTQAEKIEDLRRDVVRLFDAYNDLNRRLMAGGQVMAQRLDQAERTANEAARGVREVEEAVREHGLEEVVKKAQTFRRPQSS